MASPLFLLFRLGTVKWFDSKKGFGFITPESGEADLFVHQSSIHAEGFRSLADGEGVEFEVSENNGRQAAVNVTGPDGSFVQGAPYNPQGSRGPRPDSGRGGFGGDRNGGGGNYYNDRY